MTAMNYDARIEKPEDGIAQDAALVLNPLESDEEDRRSKRRIWIFAGVAVALLIALKLLTSGGTSEETITGRESQASVVTVVTPGRASVAGRINVTGALAARRELPVGMSGEGGQVVQVLVEPGQWVGAGQALAVIDRSVQNEQSAALAAQIQVAQADANLAQANLDRSLRLVDRGFVSKADIDRLTATRDAATARVKVAKAQLGEMQQRVRRLNVVAPAAGLVLERHVEPGQVVSSSSGVLFSLAKGGEMEMLARVSEADLALLSPGVTAEVTPVGSAKAFAGQVWQVSPVIDPQTRQGTARIALAYAPELRPGGFANAAILSGTVIAPVLPESAVLSDSEGSFVFIIGKGNKVERRAVKLGEVTENGLVVLSGLTGSERIVVRAGAFLAPGEVVTPKAAK
jgi:RND family efflux transporter MFP subunit